MNRFKELGTIARRGVPSGWMGEARKAVAECKRLLEMRIRSAGKGRHQKDHLAGRCSKTLSDGTQVIAWINPFGLRPTVAVRVVRPAPRSTACEITYVLRTIDVPGYGLQPYPVLAVWGARTGEIFAQRTLVDGDRYLMEWDYIYGEDDPFDRRGNWLNSDDVILAGEPVVVFRCERNGEPQPVCGRIDTSPWTSSGQVVLHWVTWSCDRPNTNASVYTVRIPLEVETLFAPVEKSELMQQTIIGSDITELGYHIRNTSDNPTLTSHKGWYLDFDEGEEAVQLYLHGDVIPGDGIPDLSSGFRANWVYPEDQISSSDQTVSRGLAYSNEVFNDLFFASKRADGYWLGCLRRLSGRPYIVEDYATAPRSFYGARLVQANPSCKSVYAAIEVYKPGFSVALPSWYYGALTLLPPLTVWPPDREFAPPWPVGQ